MSFQFINWDFGNGAVSSVVMSDDEYARLVGDVAKIEQLRDGLRSIEVAGDSRAGLSSRAAASMARDILGSQAQRGTEP